MQKKITTDYTIVVSVTLFKINNLLIRSEKKFTLAGTSFLLSFCMLLIAANFVTPGFKANFHGHQYSLLSNNPLDFDTVYSLQYRLLGPAIGYVTGLRGDLFLIVPLVFALGFLAAVYLYYRKKGFQPVDAFSMVCLMAFSCTILMPIFAAGYTDTISYFFIFMAIVFTRNALAFTIMFALALLNHESNIVLLPALLLLLGNQQINWGKYRYVFAFILLIISLVPLLIVRKYISDHTHVIYDLDFYFNEGNFRSNLKNIFQQIPLGIFLAFKLFWFFPIYFLVKKLPAAQYFNKWVVILILAATFSQLIIAYDVTRLIVLAFPAILLAAEQYKYNYGDEKFRSVTMYLTAFNLIILPYYMAVSGLMPMLPWWYNTLGSLL